MEGIAALSGFIGLFTFIISIILIVSIISIANSNVRMRRGVELMLFEIRKANYINRVQEKYDVQITKQKEELAEQKRKVKE